MDPTRVWFPVCVPHFFGSFADTMFFFLSLSLSLSLRRWGNPNQPLVFLLPQSLTSTRTSRTTPTSRLPPRLFFLPTSFVFPVVVGRGLSWLFWASLSFSFLVVLLRCVHECRNQTERGGRLLDGAPAYYRNYCFLGLSTKRCPAGSVLNRLCSPHLLPQSPKVGAGKGGGGAGRTVTQMLCWLGGPYCHANFCSLCPFYEGGNAVRFWGVFRVWFGSLDSFFVVLLLVAV